MATVQTQATSQGTRERLLDTAETLFARQGFAATSLRSITAEARVNLAAIHYHFGSKEALIREVFARRIQPVNRERLEGLDALEAEAGDGPLDLERLVETFVGPGLRLARKKEGGVVMSLLGRTHSEPMPELRRIFFEQFRDLKDRFVAAFHRALPELSEEELYWRLHFLVGAMAQTMGEPDRLQIMSEGLCDPTDVDGTIRRIVPFLAAGLRAPLPEEAS